MPKSPLRWAVLLGAGAVALYLCARLLRPFLDVIAWSAVLVVTFYPAHRALLRRTRHPYRSAFLGLLEIAPLRLLLDWLSRRFGVEPATLLQTASRDAGRFTQLAARYSLALAGSILAVASLIPLLPAAGVWIPCAILGPVLFAIAGSSIEAFRQIELASWLPRCPRAVSPPQRSSDSKRSWRTLCRFVLSNG
jgi:hypothetical protein